MNYKKLFLLMSVVVLCISLASAEDFKYIGGSQMQDVPQ